VLFWQDLTFYRLGSDHAQIDRAGASMRTHILLPAAGIGLRFGGDTPKQYLMLLGKPVLQHVIERLAPAFDESVIHIALSPEDRWFDAMVRHNSSVIPTRCGGASREHSVYNVLRAMQDVDDDDWIVVHDAVRPCIDRASLARLRQVVGDDEVGGLLGVPIADTLKRVDDQGRVVRTEVRDGLWRAQTPQMFRYGVLSRAFARPGIERWTDEAQAVEALGLRPRMAEGALTNLKITFPEDLRFAAAILSMDRESGGEKTMARIGFGQDSHRFSSQHERRLVLGGVDVPDEAGLDGNSDADVVLHALCRALEQAIGKDSFSRYADELCRKGVTDSREYVRVAMQNVEAAGYGVNNVGITIEAARPKIEPLRAAMRASIAALLRIEEDAVGINASSGEKMTPFGKGEGIQAFAIVSLDVRR
jgi:2-C-methyl-D-erythritol 4-phosphate cytidylyltransferase/2-C-methyl-D-erythritol 2,4-cyclodiphosphate synthase